MVQAVRCGEGGGGLLEATGLAFSIIAMALQLGHVTRTPRRVTTLSAVAWARCSRRHARQKVWAQGRLTGWSKGSRQMEHFGTVEVSGSALEERALIRLQQKHGMIYYKFQM